MSDKKRRWGDRRDARLVRDNESMQAFMPYIYPNRADNEAFIRETIDITELQAYLAKKNEGKTTDKYTLMYAAIAAIVRSFTLRPKMNRFVKGHRMYQRDEVSVGFVVKKQFKDDGKEALAYLSFGPETTIDTVYAAAQKEIHSCRDANQVDNSTGIMDILVKLPRWVLRIIMRILNFLDYHGKVPYDLIKADPNHATVMISNLGSIKLNAAYHHLSNWGTMSVFLVIGEIHKAPIFNDDGTYEMRTVVDLGMTIDERIADGYYYSGTIRMIKKLLANPELLEQRADTEVEV